MMATPQEEHQWLHQFEGNWTAEVECVMAPGQPPNKSTATAKGRRLGELWILIEGEAPAEGGGTWQSIITLGFDPKLSKFVGTFVGGMMTHLWPYAGNLDESGKLVLDSEGPSFDGSGDARFQDILEVVDADHWVLSSQFLLPDGQWSHFMTAHYHRAKD